MNISPRFGLKELICELYSYLARSYTAARQQTISWHCQYSSFDFSNLLFHRTASAQYFSFGTMYSFVFVYFSHIFYFEFWARSCVFERPRLRWPRRYWLTAPCITDAAPHDSKSTRNRISYNQKQYLGRKKAKKNGKNPRLRVFYSVTWMSVPLCFVETPYVPSPGRT